MKNTEKKLSLLQKQLIVMGSVVAGLFLVTVVLYALQLMSVFDFIGEEEGADNDAQNIQKTESPGYFDFMYKLLGGKSDDTETKDDSPRYDEDGDLLGVQDRPYIYDVIPFEKVAGIEIQNVDAVTGDVRNFSFYMDPIAENLILAGREMLSFDKEKLSYLYVNTCNMLAMDKVDDPSEDLSQYGLAGGVSDNWFIVTTVDGEKKQVYIGDKFPTGAAYYCKSADKPHIYVIDTMVDQCVLASPDDFIVPMLCPPISQENIYTVDDIKIVSGGKLMVNLVKAPEKASDNNDGTAFSHIMTYPGGYTVSQTVVDNILMKLSSFQGTEVVTSDLFGMYTSAVSDSSDEAITARAQDPEEGEASEAADNSTAPEELSGEDKALRAILEKYGFVTPSHEILYTFDGTQYRIIFGNKTEDGASYYALNMTQMTVCTVLCTDVAFLDYELIDFVDEYIFQMNIDNLESIEVKTRKSHEKFMLSGEKSELVVKKQSDGGVIDTKTFRQFYIDVLLVTLTGKADSVDTTNEVLAYTFTTRDGRTYEYRFYDISTTKVFYTVDGKGEFYVNRDSVNKVIGDFDMLLAGQTFISEAVGG